MRKHSALFVPGLSAPGRRCDRSNLAFRLRLVGRPLRAQGLNRQSFLDLRPSLAPDAPRAAWNLGQKMGLTGHASLLPLLAIWGVGAGAWALGGRADRAGRRPGVTLGA